MSSKDGHMASTGNHIQDAASAFKSENHFAYFANLCSVDVGTEPQTIRWDGSPGGWHILAPTRPQSLLR